MFASPLESWSHEHEYLLTSICLKSQTAWTGNFPLTGVAGLRGFSWTMVLALRFSPSKWVLNSFSCSFSSYRKYHIVFNKTNNDRCCCYCNVTEVELLNFTSSSRVSQPTAASCNKSSSRVTVMLRLHVYFFFMVFCIFFIFSSASFTSEKNYNG